MLENKKETRSMEHPSLKINSQTISKVVTKHRAFCFLAGKQQQEKLFTAPVHHGHYRKLKHDSLGKTTLLHYMLISYEKEYYRSHYRFARFCLLVSSIINHIKFILSI